MSTDGEPSWWLRRPANAWLRVGISSTIIFGGGLVLRLAFVGTPTAMGATFLAIYAVLTALAVTVLAIGIQIERRKPKAR